MEFYEKLQQLRKQKNLTQEELAKALFVSRTAISKWESGRGYPNIDSLKAIAAFYGVTIDDLLSGDELLNIAEEDTKKQRHHIRDLVFGLLDVSVAAFLFLPLFGQTTNGTVQEVSLLSLGDISLWVKAIYLAIVIITIGFGVATLALQNCERAWWVRHKSHVSLILTTIGALAFIVSMQPYAATLLFIFLIIKVLLLTKKP